MSPSCPASVLSGPHAVPPVSLPIHAPSRLRPPRTHRGRRNYPGLRARCSADGSGGATGRCPRGPWPRPRSRVRPGLPTSPAPRRAPAVLPAALSGPAAPPHPPTPPRFLFPAGSPGLSWRGPRGPPTPARPPTGRGRHTHAHTTHTHPARPRRTHLVPATRRADSCRHPPHPRRQGAAGHPEPWTRQVSAALATHVLRQTGHIHPAGSGFRSHTQDPFTLTSTCMVYVHSSWSHIPAHNPLVYFSGNSCKVWGQGLRSRQNFHTCPFSGIIALQCRAGLQPGTGHSHDSPSPKHPMPKHLQDPDLP